jgi:hypothetical protein
MASVTHFHDEINKTLRLCAKERFQDVIMTHFCKFIYNLELLHKTVHFNLLLRHDLDGDGITLLRIILKCIKWFHRQLFFTVLWRPRYTLPKPPAPSKSFGLYSYSPMISIFLHFLLKICNFVCGENFWLVSEAL